MKNPIQKAQTMVNIQLISWLIVLSSVIFFIAFLNSPDWTILIFVGYVFQLFGAVYIFFITKYKFGKRLFFFNVFMIVSLLIFALFVNDIFTINLEGENNYVLGYPIIALVILLYFFSALILLQLRVKLRESKL